MEYITHYLTNSDCFRAAKPLPKPAGIVVHSTGVNQKRIAAYTAQWNRPGVKACVHGMLGLDEAGGLCYTRILPYTVACWGCGSGPKGSYNASHIQFEICEDLNDPDWCRRTYAAALEVCTKLCREFGISPDAVVCHSEAHASGFASNHADVMHWWPRQGFSMAGFRSRLSENLKKEETTLERYKTVEDIPAPLRPEMQALIDAGILKGTGGETGLDLTEDMVRTAILCKRYADWKTGGETK